MNKMKIRVKMMLWYTLLTSILLAMFLPVLYHTISVTLLDAKKNNIQVVMSQVVSSIDTENNSSEDQDIPSAPLSMPTIIWNTTNQVIYSNTGQDWLTDFVFDNENIRRLHFNGSDWLIYDKTVQKNNGDQVKIRVSSSLEDVEATLRKILILLFAVLPIYFLITILGGLLIAKRALHPVSKVTELAKNINLSDLSKRITGINSTDEVGELSNTFNQMLESLEQSFEKEKRFTSDASHELRTPVSVIMANAEALLTTEQNTDTKKSVSAILTESKRMNTIISQLLMLARGVEGKYKPNFEKTSMNLIIEAVLEQLHDEASSKEISLIDTTNSEVFVFADQSLITQMMLNLISNSIKYGKASGFVWVNAAGTKSDCIVTIKDDGIGISKEDLPFIFNRFYRADKSRDRSGSGLGLSIVNWIVDEHKGCIDVHSEIGVGTTISIHLKNET